MLDNSFQVWAKRAFANHGIECRSQGNWMVATIDGVEQEVMSYAGVTSVIVGFSA